MYALVSSCGGRAELLVLAVAQGARAALRRSDSVCASSSLPTSSLSLSLSLSLSGRRFYSSRPAVKLQQQRLNAAPLRKRASPSSQSAASEKAPSSSSSSSSSASNKTKNDECRNKPKTQSELTSLLLRNKHKVSTATAAAAATAEKKPRTLAASQLSKIERALSDQQSHTDTLRNKHQQQRDKQQIQVSSATRQFEDVIKQKRIRKKLKMRAADTVSTSTTVSPVAVAAALTATHRSQKIVNAEVAVNAEAATAPDTEADPLSGVEWAVESVDVKRVIAANKAPKKKPLLTTSHAATERHQSMEHEREFLSAITFQQRNKMLDERARQLISQMPSLSRSSTNPLHLTSVEDSFAEHVANKLHAHIFKPDAKKPHHQQQKQQQQQQQGISVENKNVVENLFVEYNPGFGLVTQKLTELVYDSRSPHSDTTGFMLVESNKRFQKHLKQMQATHSHGARMSLICADPFSVKFVDNDGSHRIFAAKMLAALPPQSTKMTTAAATAAPATAATKGTLRDIRMSVYGVLPWNTMTYLANLFSKFGVTRGLFSLSGSEWHVRTLTFYLYVNELALARVLSQREKRYASYRASGLGAMAARFTRRLDVIDEVNAQHFFPYPLVSTPHHYKQLQFNRLYLLRMEFDLSDDTNQREEQQQQQQLKGQQSGANKLFGATEALTGAERHLYTRFVRHLFARPSIAVSQAVRPLCRDVDMVCRFCLVQRNTPVAQLDIQQIVLLFRHLNERHQLCDKMLLHHPVTISAPLSRRQSLSSDLSGAEHSATDGHTRQRQHPGTFTTYSKSMVGQFILDEFMPSSK